MEDKKGPGPKKKILVRKSTETREPYILDKTKEEKSPMEMKVGDARINPTSEKEINLLKEKQGLRDVYSLEGKTLIPKSKIEQKRYEIGVENLSNEEAGNILKINEFKETGNIPSKKALGYINRLSEIVDKNAEKMNLTDEAKLAGAKDFLIAESGKEGSQYKVDENIWKELNKDGRLNSVIMKYSRNKKEAAKAPKYRQGSVGVDEPMGEMKKESPESKVVENRIDSAVKLEKDSKGVVRKVMKDTK
jgi:hypothetical protein